MALFTPGPIVSHVLMVFVAMLNICILSYDAGMINNLNSVKPYQDYFKLNSDMIGLNVAIISAETQFHSSLSAASSSDLPPLINGSIAPMWVMEVAAPKYSSILSSTVLTSVPFTSFLVSCIVLGIYDKQSDWAWRGLMLGEAVPSIISLSLLPFVDESPRWLFSKGRHDEAIGVLARLHANGNREDALVLSETQEIVAALNHEKESNGGWKDLIAPSPNLKRFTIATNAYAIGAIVVVALFLLAVAASWSILAYTYPPEVLRYSQRAKGVVVAQAIGYAFSFLNLYTTPLAIEKISWRYYAINGGWNLGILFVVTWLFVETKGRTLEEMDEIFDGVVYSNNVIIDGQNSKSDLGKDAGDSSSVVKRKLSKVSTRE
ncbi:uncharacterized protein N0V96_000742 [Colletotrichum fioriniae]|uniref:uncharacterized protein n=1 Tax=Colletotrichum fioriniae TaxID=710243 RepID=UPI0032DB3B92|nr:hypothetical protein N0V96_000742 [Colletotrichum fioriniae]